VIPARTAVQARELHASGWTVSAIARHLGHDRRTVRIYLAGARDPGQPRADTPDLFGPFGAYATRRLREDPHLSATALHRELAGLGYAGSYSALTRSLRQRDLLTDCPGCQRDRPPEITRRASLLTHLHPRQGLPIRVAPVPGQTIASYLDQIAAANHLPAATLLAHLPAWFRHQYRVHDDLAGGVRARRDYAEALARLTRNEPNALLRTLPSLAGRAGLFPASQADHRLPPLHRPAWPPCRDPGPPARAATALPAPPDLARPGPADRHRQLPGHRPQRQPCGPPRPAPQP